MQRKGFKLTASKKSAIVLFVFIFAVSIFAAACGTKDGTANSEETPKVEDANDKEKSSLPEKKVVLKFASWATQSDMIYEAYEIAINNFNKNNDFNAEIKPSYTPGDQYKTQLATQMAANEVPDIFGCWPAGRMKPYVDAERLYPISDLIDKDAEWKSRYKEGVFAATTFNGKIYGIPQFQANSIVYYNKEMFAEYSLEVPETWKDLLNVISVLKSNGKEGFALDGKEPWVGAMYGAYIADRIDPEAFKKVQSEPNWLIPAYIETGKKIQELLESGAFPKGCTSLDYVQARNLFDTEQAGMYVMGTWDVGYFSDLEDGVPVKGKVGVFKFPSIEGGKGSSNNWLTVYEAVLAMSANTENPEAAGAFLKSLSNDEIAKSLVAEKGYISTAKVEPDPSKLSPLFKEALGLLEDVENTFPFYDNQLGDVIGNEFNNAIQAIVSGGDPEDAFAKVDKTAKDEMK